MALKRCHTSFYYVENGAPRVVRVGDIVDDSDDAYKKHKGKFETPRVTNFPARAFEQASAAPGEKRRVSRKGDA